MGEVLTLATAVVVLATAVMAWHTRQKVDQAAKKVDEASEKVDQVHVLANSSFSRLEERVAQLTAELVRVGRAVPPVHERADWPPVDNEGGAA